MTPQGVPLLISHLSQALDRVLRAALSWNENKISFLESNAPDSYYPTVLNEIKQAHNLRHEIDMLTATLTHERQLNKYLQRDIVNGRKKSDAMCAMMTLIRTETEAVLRRHNVILSTPGACRKAADLHKKAKLRITTTRRIWTYPYLLNNQHLPLFMSHSPYSSCNFRFN